MNKSWIKPGVWGVVVGAIATLGSADRRVRSSPPEFKHL